MNDPELTQKTASPLRQAELHTLIFMLDLAWKNCVIFSQGLPNIIGLLNDLVRSQQEIATRTRIEPDIARRMELNTLAKRQAQTAVALRGIVQGLDFSTVVGNENFDAFRAGIEQLQRECGCDECATNAKQNMVDRLSQDGPLRIPRFTGPPSKWFEQIVAWQKEKEAALREEKKLIIT